MEQTLLAPAQGRNHESARRPHELEILSPLRFVLAISVIAQHFWGTIAVAAGDHAVVGFFCISGFLITRICATNYRNRPGAFLLNRFLRIYPQYALAIVLGMAVVLLQPDAARALNSALVLPANSLEWAKQVFIIGLYDSPVRLSPPTWSLNVEIYFYLLIGLVTHRSEKLTYAALTLSLAVGAMVATHILPDFVFYGSPVGNAFVFFLGSSAYFLSRRVSLPARLPPIALAVYAVSAWVLPNVSDRGSYRNSLFVISAFMVFVVLIQLPVIRTRNDRLAAGLNFLGRVSYPLFLVHWAASTWLFALIGWDNPLLFLGGLASSLAAACVLVLLIDRPMERIRARIRAARRGPALAAQPVVLGQSG